MKSIAGVKVNQVLKSINHETKVKPQTPKAKSTMNDLDIKSTVKPETKDRSYCKVTKRDIAKMFTSAMQLKDYKDIEAKVNDYMVILDRMPKNQILALKMAYVFASKVPFNEREDFYQELALCLLKAKVKDEKLAYTITRCNWLDFWRDYKRKATHYGGSLEAFDLLGIENTEHVESLDSKDKRTIREYITGVCEFETIDAEIDATSLYRQLPDDIKVIVNKRLAGDKLENREYKKLNYFITVKGGSLLTNAIA